MPRRVTILGSTGSIGRSALEVIRQYPGEFEIVGLAAHSSAELLAEQAAEFRPKRVALVDADAASRFETLLPAARVESGAEALEALAAAPADTVLCAMVGAVGLKPLLRAIEAGNNIAIANKEPLVMAGALILERARERGVRVLPVDSEHNAIFQCLQGHRVEDVRCIHLTASGGPFYGRPREALRNVTPEEAARHPRWNMGTKISVDSATLMNKGLEVIEAMWLFGVPAQKIEVIIHPQSIVHSLVEFTDGSILAHLGLTDMKFPIQYALTWPDRAQESMGRLDLAAVKELTFAAPDFAEFPCLRLALEAARAGGTAPALLNAANEAAVEAFCARRITFLSISEVVGEVMSAIAPVQDAGLEGVVAADCAARVRAREAIERLGEKSRV